MPSLPGFLPVDQSINFFYCFALIELIHRDSALEEGIHVELSIFRALAEKLKNTFDPAHQLIKEAVIVEMNLVNKFIEIVFMTLAKVDESLNGLIWICGDVLLLTLLDDLH
jgi:hypothetical protein